MKFLRLALVFFHSLIVCDVMYGQFEFELYGDIIGINDTTKSYGMYWGDLNNDFYPDLYVPNHYNPFVSIDPTYELEPIVYMNDIGLGFNKVTLSDSLVVDFHGGLIYRTKQSNTANLATFTGSTNKNTLYAQPINNDFFPDTTCGFCPSSGRTRTAIALDYNFDGRTDIFTSNEFINSPGFFLSLPYEQQEDFTFQRIDSLELLHANYAFQADIDNDGVLEFTTVNDGRYRIYDMGPSGFDFLFLGAFGADDMIVEDFDNDGKFEVLAAEKKSHDQLSHNSEEIDVYLEYDTGYVEIVFSAPSQFEYQVFSYPNAFSGSAGQALSPLEVQGPHLVYESAPIFEGWATNVLALNYANIGYSESDELWRIQLNRENPRSVRFRVQASGGLSLSSFQNIDTNQVAIQMHFMEFEDQGGIPSIISDEIVANYPVSSMVAEDFDNDGDLDIIIQEFDKIDQQNLRLIENINGQLQFEDYTEIQGSDMAISDVVTSMDFDRDGKMDVGSSNAEGFPGEYGTLDVYKNSSVNSNTWIKVSLEGSLSNADGLGAFVTVFAGGQSQKRLMDGGFHRYAQDEAALHFGLGTTEEIDSLIINWPSGINQILGPLASNNHYYINEDDGIVSVPSVLGNVVFRLFPNPSKGELMLNNTIEGMVKIFTLSGELVYSSSAAANHVINLNQAQRGVYILQFTTQDQFYEEKFLLY